MPEGKYEDWVTVFSSGMDYEADLVRDRLDDSGIPAVVLTQRDHAFNLNVGDLASVRVLVQPDRVEEARALLEDDLITDEELEQAALEAGKDAPDAHSPREESALDSGNEDLELPDDDETSAG